MKLQIPANEDVMDLESKSTSEAADWVVDRLGLGTNCCPTIIASIYVYRGLSCEFISIADGVLLYLSLLHYIVLDVVHSI